MKTHHGSGCVDDIVRVVALCKSMSDAQPCPALADLDRSHPPMVPAITDNGACYGEKIG